MIDVTKCRECGQPEHHSFHDRQAAYEDYHSFEPTPAPGRSRRSDTIAELLILAVIIAGLMIMWLT